MRLIPILLLIGVSFSVACQQPSSTGTSQAKEALAKLTNDSTRYSEAVFASGCFWCVEGVFESVQGVVEVISGYSGGTTENPTYYEVGSGNTGHAEAVQVFYDSTVVDYPTLLKVYFNSMDPTQVNGQGPDHGSAYRSIIFYENAKEKALAEQMIADLNASDAYSKPIAVELKSFEKFWPAEDYHQDYVQHHPNDNPYVLHESIPRIKRFQRKFPELIKPERNLIK